MRKIADSDRPSIGLVRRLGLCLLGALLVLLLHPLAPIRALEGRLYDLRVQWSSRGVTPSDEILIVAIDNQSMRRMEPAVGRWPWPRAVFGGLVEYCSGARAIAFDVLFPEADWQFKASDDLFAEAVRKHGNGVQAMFLDTGERGRSPVPDERFALPAGAWDMAALEHGVLLLPYRGLRDAAKRLGHINALPDEDGVVRTHVPFIQQGNRLYPSLALAAACLARGKELDELGYASGRLSFGRSTIPLNARKGFALRPPGGTYETISAADVLDSYNAELNGRPPIVERKAFADKVVVVGSLATGLQADVKVSSLAPETAGVHLNAIAIDNLLAGRFLRVPPGPVTAALIFLLAFLPGLKQLGRPRVMIVAGLGIILAYALVVVLAVARGNLMLPVTGPSMGWLFSVSFLTLTYWYSERMRRRQLEALEQSKQAFTDMLVHDMKNRAASLTMSFTMMKRKIDPGDAALLDLAAQVDMTSRRLLTNIGALLDIRKMEAGLMTLDLQPMDVGVLLDELADRLQPAAKLVGMRLGAEVHPDVPGPVSVDREIFSRVLENLVWNAIQYGREGTTIEMGCQGLPDGGCRIYVANQGPVIPAEVAENIFEPFATGHAKGRKTGGKGTGLGLSFCKMAVEAHGGRIHVESPWLGVGEGARFTVELPALRG